MSIPNVRWIRVTPMPRSAVLLTLLLGLVACDSLLTYSPTTNYDDKLVRGVVTAVATEAQMGENWDRVVKEWANAPSREEYARKYRRVTVRLERFIGGAYFAYPFSPDGVAINIGDVVDFVAVPRGPQYKDFIRRAIISRVVCRASDRDCLASPEGKRRGEITSTS